MARSSSVITILPRTNTAQYHSFRDRDPAPAAPSGKEQRAPSTHTGDLNVSRRGTPTPPSAQEGCGREAKLRHGGRLRAPGNRGGHPGPSPACSGPAAREQSGTPRRPPPHPANPPKSLFSLRPEWRGAVTAPQTHPRPRAAGGRPSGIYLPHGRLRKRKSGVGGMRQRRASCSAASARGRLRTTPNPQPPTPPRPLSPTRAAPGPPGGSRRRNVMKRPRRRVPLMPLRIPGRWCPLLPIATDSFASSVTPRPIPPLAWGRPPPAPQRRPVVGEGM